MRRLLSLSLLALSAPARAQSPEPVDLIHRLGLVLTVSSTVGNGRDLPRHLIDGDPATAWSSRTGELAGATIYFALPDDAEVTAIALTAGLTRTAPRDLFRMNPRVARVVISRDGAVVREAPLNTEDPGIQSIPVAGRGGIWTVRVSAVLPGSRPAWREVSVSEFRVMGRGGTPATHPPAVWVRRASLGPGRESIAIVGPYEGAARYCAGVPNDDDVLCGDPYGDPPGQRVCGCALEPAPSASPQGVVRLAAPAGPIRGARLVRETQDVHAVDPCVLFVDTARGTYVVPDVATCGEPRLAHDYAVTAHVDAMDATALPDGGARLTLRVREVEDRASLAEVGGPPGASTTRRATVTVRVGADGDVVSALRDERR